MSNVRYKIQYVGFIGCEIETLFKFDLDAII